MSTSGPNKVFSRNFRMFLRRMGSGGRKRVMQHAGVSQATITRWQQGEQPSARNAASLADLFGTTVAFLLHGESDLNEEVFFELLTALDYYIEAHGKRLADRNLARFARNAYRRRVTRGESIIDYLHEVLSDEPASAHSL